MKKILIALIVATLTCFAMGDEYRTVVLTVTGTTTALGQYTCPANRVAYPLEIMQDVTTDTNTVSLGIILNGDTAVYPIATLTAVADTTGRQVIGDSDTDGDQVILQAGDVLDLVGANADASNVVYTIRVKLVPTNP